jgi:hypothetical protein
MKRALHDEAPSAWSGLDPLDKPRAFLKLGPLIGGRTDRNIKVDRLLDHRHGERLHLIVVGVTCTLQNRPHPPTEAYQGESSMEKIVDRREIVDRAKVDP